MIMMKIAIIGEGNVGTHLAKAFSEKSLDVKCISSRSAEFDLTCADLILIAVHDDAIAEIARKVSDSLLRANNSSAIVAHTSGSVPMSILQESLPAGARYGVFYPMQTFSKNVAMRYDDIPFLIEASDSSVLADLKEIAGKISCNVTEANSDVRKDYHIGAVLACNFTNHLWALSDKYLSTKGLPFDLLKPLLRQTIQKLNSTSPYDAQTGPAVRHDHRVMQEHISHLSDNPEIAEIYKLISESIENNHK